MNQRSVFLSLVLVGSALGLVSACSDDEDPVECVGEDCGGATSVAGAKATGGKANGGATAGVGGTRTAPSAGGTTSTTPVTNLGGTTASSTTAAVGGAATGGAATGVGGAATGGAATGVGGAATGGATTGVGGAATGGATTGIGGAAGSPAQGGTTSAAGSSGIAGSAGDSGIAGAAGATSHPPLGPNLALNAVLTGGYPLAFASSSESTYTAEKVFDGQTNTFWVSTETATVPGSGATQYIGVEFGTAQTITAVVVKGRLNTTRAYNPSYYTVDTSNDGTTWTTHATAAPPNTWPYYATPATDPITTYLDSPVSAKYVRIFINATYYLLAGAVNPGTVKTQISELEIH